MFKELLKRVNKSLLGNRHNHSKATKMLKDYVAEQNVMPKNKYVVTRISVGYSVHRENKMANFSDILTEKKATAMYLCNLLNLTSNDKVCRLAHQMTERQLERMNHD